MELGFLTNCFDLPFTKKIEIAHEIGFDCIEVACWQKKKGNLHSGCDIDVENFSSQDADKLHALLNIKNLTISSLAYYENMLHSDLEIRAQNLNHLKHVILAAEKLSVELVGTFIGKDFNISIEENFDLFENIFVPVVHYAEKHKVKLMIENCPMPSWSQDGLPMTISYSPEFWEEMFRRIPSPYFGLNFDPSHLYWMQIDYIKCAQQYAQRIFHVHAQDIQINRNTIPYYSIYGKKIDKQDYRDMGWYEPKAPGLGEIKWSCLVKTLRNANYEGCISVEYKDSILTENLDLIKTGLLYAHNYLKPLM